EEFFQPIFATLGHPSQAAWFASHNGVFVVTLITIVLAGVLVSVGMAGYARVQKYCFIGGMIGFAIIVILLLVYSRNSFISSFDSATSRIFGTNHLYEATNADAPKTVGYTAPAFGFGGSISDSMLL